jgi:hypothetical protein
MNSAARIGPVCVILLTFFSIGCGDGGPGVVFPEPRTSVDDEEEQPTDRATAVASAARAAQSGAEIKSKKKDATGEKEKPAKANPPNTDDNTQAVAAAGRRSARRAVTTEDDRPADLAEWTHDDFRTAKLDRDGRVVQAVLLMGRSGANGEEEAKLLVELLAPTEAGPRGRRAGISGLAMAVAGALAANSSATARTAVKEILLGRLESDIDDHTLTVSTLTALANHPASDTEGILFAILTAPEAIRPPGRGAMTADALQRECVGLIQRSASPQLRARLGEHVAREATPISHRAILLPLLLEPRPENVKAQAALALSASLETSSRSTAQRQLGQCTKRILDDLWGVPDAQHMRSTADMRSANIALPDASKSAESFRVADHLWSDGFVSALGRRLEEIGTPTDEPDLWAIATSIPNSQLRRTSREILMKHWREGEVVTHAQQFSPANMRDPGMLAVLKSLPREDSLGKPKQRELMKANAQAARVVKEREARQAWQTAARAMVSALNRRLEYAARIEQLVATRNSSNAASRRIDSAEDLDQFVEQASKHPEPTSAASDEGTSGKDVRDTLIELPPQARPTAVFRAQWPEYLEGKIAAPVSPLRLHYARAEVKEPPAKLLASIERQLRGASQHALENGRWIDSVTRPEPGKLRSVDVFVTRARDGATSVPISTAARATGEKLVVEVLWLEIDDIAAGE